MSPRETLLYWIKEREAIRLKKDAGEPKPWTKDPILQKYSFCNIRREDDRVTKWIAANWRNDDPDCWFWMVVARLLNRPDTLAELPHKTWDAAKFVKILHARRARGEKLFSGAYLVSTNGHAQDKVKYLEQYVLSPMWIERGRIRPRKGDTLQTFFDRLLVCEGMGTFTAAQIVADMKYQQPLKNAADWFTFAASGPGSRRGLNRVLGQDKKTPWREEEWHAELTKLRYLVNAYLIKFGIQDLHAQDLQNCLCETDKYLRTQNGEGRPKSTYPGKE